MERSLKDSEGKTYFDRLRENMQRNRNNYISKPIVPIINNRGTIHHESINSLSSDAYRYNSINSQTIARTIQ